MKKLSRLALATACSLAISLPTFADYTQETGIYGDALAGYGKVNVDGYNIDGKNKGFNGNLDLGYKFNKYIGVEAGYNYFRKIADENSYSYDAAVKGILPIEGTCFELFAKAGVAQAHALGKYDAKTRTVALGAVGASYWLTQNVGLTVQGLGTTRRGDDVPAMYGATGGISFKF